MREKLLAYLFGQLNPAEKQALEQALATDRRLRDELQHLKTCLQGDPSACCSTTDDLPDEGPPGDLVERTCRRVQAVGIGQKSGCMGWSAVADWECGQRQWSKADLVVAVGIAMVAAMFVFPAMHQSRFAARINQCSANMMAIGEGLMAFMNLNQGRVPQVPASGQQSFAGVYTIQLAESQLVDRQLLAELRICPATVQIADRQQSGYLFQWRVPTVEELVAASGEELRELQRYAGGTYAYRFGYVQDGEYRQLRLKQMVPSQTPLLADAPSLVHDEYLSSNHAGVGQNVLFADGHVQFICNCTSLECGDQLFVNRYGRRAPGIGIADAVLARSGDRPDQD